jgi:hypothetical protein
VWSAKTLKRAQLKQRVEEPNYELECELINPKGYLEDELDDRKVAKDLLLKLREFLEPWGGYRLEGVKNKSMNANRFVRKIESAHVCVHMTDACGCDDGDGALM